jgi:hypothetical protein
MLLKTVLLLFGGQAVKEFLYNKLGCKIENTVDKLKILDELEKIPDVLQPD